MSFDFLILLLRLGIVLLLYLFLLQVVLIVRLDLSRSAPVPPNSTRLPRARLIVLDAGLTDLRPGEALSLAELNSLGRGPANSIQLADDSVSAEHALLAYREQHWWLEDRGSTNGTLANSMPVEQPTVVVPGDIITLGRVRLRLEVR